MVNSISYSVCIKHDYQEFLSHQFVMHLLQQLLVVNVTGCTSADFIIFKAGAGFYSMLLLLFLFALTFLTLRTSRMKTFHHEGQLSFIATAITLFPIPFIVSGALTMVGNDSFMRHINVIWLEFIMGVLIPILIMLVLFFPNVSMQVAFNRYYTDS